LKSKQKPQKAAQMTTIDFTKTSAKSTWIKCAAPKLEQHLP